MTDRRFSLDRIAGRVYSRFMAAVAGLISGALLAIAVVSWAFSGMAGAWIWLLGAVVFGGMARLVWRSRASWSDIDFSG